MAALRHSGRGQKQNPSKIRLCMKIVKWLLILLCALEILLLVLHRGFGYAVKISGNSAYIVNLNGEAGVPSADGEFRLIELRDDSDQYVVYAVCDGQNILYVPDFLFHTRFSGDAYWIGDTYDFCIPCSDTGEHEYLYAFDAETWSHTWNPAIEETIRFDGG